MTSEFSINAYEKNQIRLYSVFGESGSRTVIFDIVEKSGVVAPTSSAVATDQMLDLTNYTVSIRMIDTDQQTSGYIISPLAGKVSFTLPKGFCEKTGEFQCEMILTNTTNSDKIMKIIGITLIVDYPKENDYSLELNAGFTDVISITIIDEDGEVYTLQSGEQLLFRAKQNVTDTDFAITVNATAESREDDAYNIIIPASATSQLSGNYKYSVAIQGGSGLTVLIQDSDLRINKTVFSGGV